MRGEHDGAGDGRAGLDALATADVRPGPRRGRVALGVAIASLGLLGALGSACKGPPPLPAGFTVAESQAFQRAHDAEIGSPTGPLAAVASHYVGPGQTLALAVAAGELRTLPADAPPPAGAHLRIEVTDAGARCTAGCGPEPLALTEPRELVLDRFSVSLSPQSGTLRVLVRDPLARALAGYEGLPWFPVSAEHILPARFEPDPQRPSVELSTSRGTTKTFARAGVLLAELRGQPIRLVGFQAAEGTPLLIPITDATTGDTTYPVGRYLEVDPPTDGVAVLDLNRLTNPYCAYSEHYNCPIPPADNRLSFAVEAGEKTWASH